MLEIKIINRSPHPLPSYESSGAAGMDIRAWVAEPVTIPPLGCVLISTGLYIELPEGYEAQLRPRSGLATRHGITLPNAPATIDADYRGEIKVALINLSNKNFTINNGDRIAQMVVAKVEKVTWKTTQDLSETKRGNKGFGSTGIE
ncbi:MAG: dUTP diphosphatase [Chitinophagales bacterium]|nr:dUTP diphosphatase [Chitinophagales bacterium]MDW8272916.1 dUTP diphosphatase [Chitinophagales bacterium]